MIVIGTLFGIIKGKLTKSLSDNFNKMLEAERLAAVNMKRYYENKTT